MFEPHPIGPLARQILAEEQMTESRRFAEQNPVPIEIQARQEDLDRLGFRIIELSARMQVAEYHLLELIREFDERGGWNTGFLSCAHWLNWRTGLSIGAAREKVRVARALGDLPLISKAMSRGEVSYSKVRALTRIATAHNEGQLLEFAKTGTAAHVERLVRSWRRVERLEEAKRDWHRRVSRSLSAYFDEDGMLVVRGRLEPETGAVFLRALEAASDRLYEESRESTACDDDRPEPQQRRADALGLVAECALSGGLDPGTRGDRYLVTVHVDAPVLQEPEPGESRPGMAMLDDAVDVSAETARRLACDCSIVTISHESDGNRQGSANGGNTADVPDVVPDNAPGNATCHTAGGLAGNSQSETPGNTPGDVPTDTPGDTQGNTPANLPGDTPGDTQGNTPANLPGKILHVGRKRRTITPALRRALVARDRTCRFPACSNRVCDAHHVRHWADGGETKLDNLLLLCRRHHVAVHEEGFRVELEPDGRARFFHPNGWEVEEAPALPCDVGDDPMLVDYVDEKGVRIGPMTGSARCYDGPVDFQVALDHMMPRCDEPDEDAEVPSDK